MEEAFRTGFRVVGLPCKEQEKGASYELCLAI